MLCNLVLWNSVAKYIGNEIPRQFHNFSEVCLGNVSAKKNAEDSTETFVYYIGNGLCSLGILPRAVIWSFFYSWDYLFYLNYIVYLWHTWTGETEDNSSLVDHLVLVFLLVLVMAEHIRSLLNLSGRTFSYFGPPYQYICRTP